ncbi:hypothetical protein BRC67_01875 [Halobacteriales archaeon QH_3_68_24]|nr:MAG: hypothetical protein BRC67_01875 [Halobacteriales archaeon QH_3_68_24]
MVTSQDAEESHEAAEPITDEVHVNLVTHGEQGHPSEYLYEAVRAGVDADLETEYVDQCGCGGHVTRVHVE